jgi:hypothetical protein
MFKGVAMDQFPYLLVLKDCRYVLGEIAAVMEDAENLDDAWLQMPEHDEMTWRFDRLIAWHMGPAEGEMIEPKSGQQVRALLRGWARRVFREVGNRLVDQRFIAKRGGMAQPLHGPCPDIADVPERWRGNFYLVGLVPSHCYRRALPALRTKEVISARERNVV